MPALNKSNTAAVNTARQHRAAGNPAAYARLMAGNIRAASTQAQARALWQAVDEDGMADWFDSEHPLCPIARTALRFAEQVAA